MSILSHLKRDVAILRINSRVAASVILLLSRVVLRKDLHLSRSCLALHALADELALFLFLPLDYFLVVSKKLLKV